MFFLVPATVIFWLLFPFISDFLIKLSGSSLTPNEYGDMYGTLNAFFSGIAFLGLYHSIRLQSKEIKSNRLEAEASRKEMKAQTKLFNLQTQSVQKEMFETTFFQILSVFQGLADNIYYEVYRDDGEVERVIRGSQCFSIYFNIRFNFSYNVENDDLSVVAEKMYSSFDNDYGYIVGPYFRMLYQVLKFVDSSSLPQKEKTSYIKILRAKLSTFELYILFYCGLSKYGRGGFKELIEKYHLFEHLPLQLIQTRKNTVNIKSLVHLYSPVAYGDNK